MKRKLLLFIFIFMLTLTGVVNVSAKDEYDGELTIEYLLRNYNVVTLGTKDRYSYTSVNDSSRVNGSLTNVFDIGGPVLIRGNYNGTESLENEFAQKTNGIPSYIKGYLGANVRPGSKESADISNIYVGDNNNVYKSENVYVVNKTIYNYEYPVFRTDDYIGFDSLYAAIVNEQKTIDIGANLVVNDPTLLLKYKDYLDTEKNKLIIDQPGNFNYTTSDINKIYILNYDPNELYIISNTSRYIYNMPEIEIRYTDGTLYKTDSDAVYCGRKNSDEDCTGNIIWNFNNARYVKTNYTTIGHIVAPKADVELLESHYSGTLIANSVASEANKKTAIQFYPYNLDKKLSKEQGKTCVTESIDTDADVYEGSYSIDELLKNYSVVSLGHNEYSPNTKLLEHNVPKGSVNIFHMAGGFLINGDLGLEGVDYIAKNKYNYTGMRLDFRYTDSNYANSFLKGNLGNHAHLTTAYPDNRGYSSGYLYNTKFYMNNDTEYVVNKDNARAALNVILSRKKVDYHVGQYSDVGHHYSTKYKEEYISDYNSYIQDTKTGSYMAFGSNTYAKNNNFINFNKLYDSIIEQQQKIYKGSKLNKSSNGELIIPIGGNYYIDDLEDIERIRFSNWSNNKNTLTIITITDPSTINFPKLVDEYGNLISTNDWNNRWNSRSYNYKYSNDIQTNSNYNYNFNTGTYHILYPNEHLEEDTYFGNIVWNIPNANYIKLAANAPFVGHIIAPNADVETPELHFAGAMIVNSLYTKGYTEAHFYPLTVGSVGTGVGTKTSTIGLCGIEKINISGNIKWNDNNNSSSQRPDNLIVKLYADGEEVDKITITKKDNWKYSFSNKQKTTTSGRKINYTIKVDKVDNYTTLVSGYNVTNTYQPKLEALTLEYLLRNYNIVSLGTKEYFAHSKFHNKDTVKGSVTNIYDIGGPVLIRGNFKSSPNLENEFAQKTNGVPSFILGRLGDNITPGSKEYVDISDIYLGTSNTVYKSGNVYQVNNTTFKYKYPVYRNNDYLGFDSLYATIVTEQSTFDAGKNLLVNDPLLLMKYNKYIDNKVNNIVIDEPGNYTFSSATIDKIYILNYNPNEIYIINNTDKYIYEMPEVEIRYSDGRLYDTDSDAVYCGRTNEYESCTGNIIWSFKNARYVQADYSTIGHIIAPNADVELLESHYAGTIIANSITSLSNSKTAVQFYPYNLDKKLVTEKGVNCITESEDLDDDIYSGTYSLDEILKNYSIVSLGQKEHEKNTKLYQYNAPKGTTNIFHIAGGFLINGDLGVEEIEYTTKSKYDYDGYSNMTSPSMNYDYPGIRLDFRYSNANSANSYLKGNLGSNVYLTTNYGTSYNSTYLNSSKFYVASDFKVANKNIAQGIFKKSSWIDRFNDYRDADPDMYLTNNNKYMLMSKDIHSKVNNYINFERLYNSVVEQQNEINEGVKLNSSGSTITIPTGGNYTIDSLEGVSQIRFENFEKNKDSLTIITIKDSGDINFPKVVNQNGGLISTNDWNGRWNARTYSTYKEGNKTYTTLVRYYSSENVNEDTYYGNIVWNIPNATYIKLAPNAPFVGHVIAPNADLETSTIHFAGAMIVNSLNAEGHSEAHFYPLTVGSVGTGVETKKKVIGLCEIETIDINGIVTWKNDDISMRPKEVKINLFQDGKKIKDIVVTEADGWKYDIKGLPKTTVSGKKINYTITSDTILAEYSTLVSGYNVINTYKEHNLSYSIEYLLKNYNVVTLGTKNTYGKIKTNYPNGSVTNIFDIGGPVLIRGDYVGTPTYDNEFAQKTNGIPSYIKGDLGKNITPGSKEYVDVSDIYVGNNNSVHNNGSVYVVNENTFDNGYPAYRDDEYVDFDSLYASIVNEQKNLTTGSTINISSSTPYISSPGTYNLTASNVSKVSISNYDPKKLYIIRMDSPIINQMPELEIRYSNFSKYDTDSDVVYCGRKDSDEDCSGNIIWSFPNARYIKTSYTTMGHIVAPKADVELLESHYPGTMIANSITALENRKTAIQFYPYSLTTRLVERSGNTCVTESNYSNINDDIYEGKYSIDELLKNYSIVSLGQKELGDNTKLAQYGAPTGTTNIFHIVGGFLINGDLGVKNVSYPKKNIKGLNGMKLEFRFYTSGFNSSFLKGRLGTNAYTMQDGMDWRRYSSDKYPYLSSRVLYVNDYIHKMEAPLEAQLALNVQILPNITYSDEKGNYYGDKANYAKDNKSGNYLRYNNNSISHSNNYIDFKTLYDSIVYQQKNISKGQVVSPDSNGVVTIPIGGNYTIENIANAKKIRFTNYENNKNVLTIVSINDSGSINLPFEETDTWNNVYTNNYYNRWNEGHYYKTDTGEIKYDIVQTYSGEILQQETYYGNIVFNIPNANYIKFAARNSFKGHVIAPNADVELPEMNFAGAMIVNSLNAEGYSEAHFYPLTVGSVGTGTSFYETETIGTCSIEEDITITGQKIWDDSNNQDGVRPSKITLNVLADGKKVKEHEYSASIQSDNIWNYTISDLPKKNPLGKNINYTITEKAVDNYSTKIDGYNITNSYTPKKTSVTVNKAWEDEDDNDGIRPKSVMVQLYKQDYVDEIPVGTPVELSEENNWTHVFTELDMFQNEGTRVVYKVKEVITPEGYTSVLTGDQTDGYTITNTHKPEKTSLSINKVWDDEDNRDRKRPSNIKIQLYADGEVLGDIVTLNEANNWVYEYTDLYVYKGGNKINYVVKEVIDNNSYTSNITGTMEDGYTITNSYSPEKISLSINKVWDDENNTDGIRPSNINIQLYANNEALGEVIELNEENNWTHNYEQLYVYKDGVKIEYTIKEIDIEGYTSEIIFNGENGYTITNSHIPSKTSLIIDKEWKDENNKDGIRPESVEVQLYKDGVALGEPVKLSEENSWTYKFEKLYVYNNGEIVNYTVKELTEVDGYESVIIGNKDEGYTIINTHIVKQENPLTIDNITKFMIISIISSVMLVLGILFYTKLRRKEV